MLERLVLTARRMNPEIEQTVISLATAGVIGPRLNRSGVTVEALGMGLSPGSLGRLATLARRLRAGETRAIVQTWLWHADLIGGLCARAAGNRRVVWNLRNSMPNHPATKSASRLVARWCARLSRRVPAAIICNSSAALQAHLALGYCADKCVVIPNGFDLRASMACDNARDETRARWGVTSAEGLVGMVARVDPLKDHATFIHAAARVAAHAARVRFVLVGEGVTRDGGIETLLAQTNLRGRFILEERSDDVRKIMSALDVFCLASRSEGFPNVVGEAMACATPTVATDVGDVRSILRDDRLVAVPEDPASLAACIDYVLRLDEHQRQILGESQRQRIGVGVRYRASLGPISGSLRAAATGGLVDLRNAGK